MNNQLNEATNKRYQDMAEGKEPQPVQTDVLWITPRLLGWTFGVGLVVSVVCLDVLQLI